MPPAHDAPVRIPASIKKRLAWVVTILLCVQCVGCADFARWLRQYTYPPDFRYIERNQLRSTMWQLAFHWRELNRLLGLAEKQEPDRAEIIAHLRGMEQAAEKLVGTGLPSNHPLLDTNLPAFRQNIHLHGKPSSANHPIICSPVM
jgi:hypothetical protein